MDLSQIKEKTEDFERYADFNNSVLDEINRIVGALFYEYDMIEPVKKLIILFYKIKIETQERGLRLMEEEKNLSIETSTSADIIERYANNQLEWERAKEELKNFIEKGELPDF